MKTYIVSELTVYHFILFEKIIPTAQSLLNNTVLAKRIHS